MDSVAVIVLTNLSNTPYEGLTANIAIMYAPQLKTAPRLPAYYSGCPEITLPVPIATPTTLPGTMMAFTAWQRGQVQGRSSAGPSGVHPSIRTFACP